MRRAFLTAHCASLGGFYLVHWSEERSGSSIESASPFFLAPYKMAKLTRAPYELPADYLQNWMEFAAWSIKHSHGPGARYCVMFALALRRSTLACKTYITRISPRVWRVETRTCTTQRASLFEDHLMKSLLDTIDYTADFPTPLFPNCPCGSHRTDDWAHGLAKRHIYRGHTNFQAISVEFKIEAGPAWTPLEIYLVSVCIFRNMFKMSPHDECPILMNQLGLVTPKNVFHNLHWFRSFTPPCAEGSLRLDAGQLICHEIKDLKETSTTAS